MNATTTPNPLRDPDVLKASCPRGRCVLNAGHDEGCRTHYLAGDRVLQSVGFMFRRVERAIPGEREVVAYVKAVTPCCGVPSWEPAERFTWREKCGHAHTRRCGYRPDGSGKRTARQGCGWSWTIEPIHPVHRESFAEGMSMPLVWVVGRG